MENNQTELLKSALNRLKTIEKRMENQLNSIGIDQKFDEIDKKYNIEKHEVNK